MADTSIWAGFGSIRDWVVDVAETVADSVAANANALECDPSQMPPADTAWVLDRFGVPSLLSENITPVPLDLPRTGTCVRIAVPEREAKRLFDDLANLTFIDDKGSVQELPYTYPTDGCYARAHLMAQRLSDLGISVRKIFSEGDLLVPSPYAEDAPADQPGVVAWGWHVAPTIRVTDARGRVQTMVMDPSITKGPVTPEQWNAIMGGNGALTYANANAYYPRDARSQPTPATAAKSEADALPTLSEYADTAPAHALAAEVRKILAGRSPVSCDSRDAQARKLIDSQPPALRALFMREFPELSKLLDCSNG